MSSAPTPTSSVDESIDMLRRLATLGMRLAEETVERAVNSPYHPEPRHEPCQAFARVSRAVRLTIVLKARFEAGPLAFRNTNSGARTGAPPRSDDDVDGAGTLDPARESLSESESYDETRGLALDACITAAREDPDAGRSVIVEAADSEAADETCAFRERPSSESKSLGHWFQKEWPDPLKPPGTG